MCRTRNVIAILILSIGCRALTAAGVCPYATARSINTNCQQTIILIHGGCYCYTTFISCRDLQEVPPLVTGDNISDYTTIYFDDGNISTLYNNSLPAGMESISFSGHPLTNIHDDAFDTSAESLKYLTITGARFTQLPHALLTLKNLTRLDLFDTPIEVWDNLTMEHLATSVRSIRLQNVGLKAFPKWFSFFHSLFYVSLSGNLIQSIPDDALVSSKDTLIYLRLESTGLVRIPTVLSYLKRLAWLSLRGNKIIDENGRPGIQQLANIPSASKLYALYLNSMGLHEIPDLSSMTSLITIELQDNQISDSSKGVLPPSVTSLRLQRNKLPAVPVLIADITNLDTLDLSYNQITVLNFDVFPPGLDRLDLSSNNITVIESSNATMDSQLYELTLTSNPLSTISPTAFKSLTSLNTLYLSGSNLIRLPDALASLTKLNFLFLDTVSKFACLCPAPQILVQWYSSLNRSISLPYFCNNTYVLVSEYLSSDCPIQPTVTTPGGNASALLCSVICRYLCLLLLLTLNCCYHFYY